jgi:hypothetical protein
MNFSLTVRMVAPPSHTEAIEFHGASRKEPVPTIHGLRTIYDFTLRILIPHLGLPYAMRSILVAVWLGQIEKGVDRI